MAEPCRKNSARLRRDVAADRKQTTSVLANFRQLAGERPVRIHPMVARLIDPDVLAKIRGGQAVGGGRSADENSG